MEDIPPRAQAEAIKARYRIAVSLMGPSMDQVLRDIESVDILAQENPNIEFLIEARMDKMTDFVPLKLNLAPANIEKIIKASSLAKIFTHRHPSESGDPSYLPAHLQPGPIKLPVKHSGAVLGTEALRLAYLHQAAMHGAEYIDIEHRFYDPEFDKLKAGKTKVIVSCHEFHNTPRNLFKLYKVISEHNSDIVKLAVAANSFSDNLHMLEVIKHSRDDERNIPLIGVSMGKDPIVRVYGPILGSYLTFASPDENRISAPGQMSARQLVEVWKRMRYI